MNNHYDLAVNLPLRAPATARLTEAFGRFLIEARMLGYPLPGGDPAVLAALGEWMTRHGGHRHVAPRHLVLTLGARHALSLALDATCRPGDILLMEALTYHGFHRAATARGIKAVSVAMDEHGMRADALEEAAQASGARTVYVQPTLHNPTTITMPPQRREAIAAVATKRGLTIIEGDVYSPLLRDAAVPLADLVPERCYHAGGIGKVLGPGLRIGWLRCPGMVAREGAAAVLADATDGLPAFLPAIVAGWITDGTADALLEDLRTALDERNAIARTMLGAGLMTGDGMHAWLPCESPQAWATRAAEAGVGVTVGSDVAQGHARGLRISLTAEEDGRRLEEALRIVAGLR